MLERFLNMLKSLHTKKRVDEARVSTSIDDTVEGKRHTFDEKRVRELMEKCDLLEKPRT